MEHSMTVAGLAPITPPVSLTPEMLKTLVDSVMVEFAPIACAAAEGHFPSYSFLADQVAQKAVRQHGVDACSFTVSRVCDELYPRLALPMLHLSAPDEEKVKKALLDAVAFGSAFGLSLNSASKAQALGRDQLAQHSFSHMAGWKEL